MVREKAGTFLSCITAIYSRVIVRPIPTHISRKQGVSVSELKVSGRLDSSFQ